MHVSYRKQYGPLGGGSRRGVAQNSFDKNACLVEVPPSTFEREPRTVVLLHNFYIEVDLGNSRCLEIMESAWEPSFEPRRRSEDAQETRRSRQETRRNRQETRRRLSGDAGRLSGDAMRLTGDASRHQDRARRRQGHTRKRQGDTQKANTICKWIVWSETPDCSPLATCMLRSHSFAICLLLLSVL